MVRNFIISTQGILFVGESPK